MEWEKYNPGSFYRLLKINHQSQERKETLVNAGNTASFIVLDRRMKTKMKTSKFKNIHLILKKVTIMRLKTKYVVLIISGFLLLKAAIAQPYCPVIPLPQKAEFQKSSFLLNQYTPVLVSDESLKGVAYYLQKELLRSYDIPLVLQSASAKPA